MVDVGLVGGEGLLHEDVGIGGELRRVVGAALGHLRQESHEVHELLAVGEQIDEPGRHERGLRRHAFVDRILGHDGLAAAGRGIAENEFRVGLAGHDARQAAAVVGEDRDAAVGGADRGRGVEERLDDVVHEPIPRHALRHGGQVGPEGRVSRAGDVALCAGEVARVEEVRSFPGIARVGHLGDECGAVLGGQRGRQAAAGRRRFGCGRGHGEECKEQTGAGGQQWHRDEPRGREPASRISLPH